MDRSSLGWPQPLDPATNSPEAVERRLRVTRIYEELDGRLAKGPNRGKPGSKRWRRKVYGDGQLGEA